MSAFCNLPFSKLRIKSDGLVSFCCIQDAVLGNLTEQTLDEIWRGPVAEEVRRVTRNGQLHGSCAGRFCPHEYQNRWAFPAATAEFPRLIDLDLPNTHCNIGGVNPSDKNPACIMCPRSAVDFQPEKDCLGQICSALKPYLVHIDKLHVQGIAEPFWKGKIFEILDNLEFSKVKHKILLSTFTNGTVFGDKISLQYQEQCPLSLTYFSLDAATQDTYKTIRRIDAFDLVIRNIERFMASKSHQQRVRISNNINTFNVHEAEKMVVIAKQLGVECIEFNSTDPCDENMKAFTVNRANRKLFLDAESKIKMAAVKLGLQVFFIKSIARTLPSQSLPVI